ncbi:SMI1/KNR4 family protein [Paenibacillus sp. FSL R7-269]|uniref:SMI1/KNR4 family protein n=1 Tax=Paenibacillus sp. FSL R7-269 TaxID=1226755 RepID=UPI000A076993|nr:SMI1/KNR4 family protein [Paenibacillus sp. FSL R7-269]
MRMNVNTVVLPLPSDELLDAVERSLRVSFPEVYRIFIKENNGVVPITNVFSFKQQEYLIEKFLCVLDDSESDHN